MDRLSRGQKRRSAAGAGAKVAESRSVRVGLCGDPSGRSQEALRQQSDVESECPSQVVLEFLRRSEEIEKQRSNTRLTKDAGDKLVATTVAAAATAVGEEHQAARSLRDVQGSFELRGSRHNMNLT
jgi:ubiquitin